MICSTGTEKQQVTKSNTHLLFKKLSKPRSTRKLLQIDKGYLQKFSNILLPQILIQCEGSNQYNEARNKRHPPTLEK